MTNNNLPVFKEYLVRWEIELDAASPEVAAREALRIQRDRDSAAIVFEIFDPKTGERQVVDLAYEELHEGEFGEDPDLRNDHPVSDLDDLSP